jgi:hypothetical protein
MGDGGHMEREGAPFVSFCLSRGTLELRAHHHLEGGTLERRELLQGKRKGKQGSKASSKRQGQRKGKGKRLKG